MLQSFAKNRPFIENEFDHPHWIPDSGLAPEELSRKIQEIRDENRGKMHMALVRAKAFGFLLDNVQIEINPHSIFADKLNIGINYQDDAKHDLFALKMFHSIHEEVLTEKIPELYARRKLAGRIGVGCADSDYWHTYPVWDNLLKLGFPGLLQRAKDQKAQKAAEGVLSEEQAIFYDAVILSYEAILRYMQRLYDYSLQYDIPEYSACLKNLMTAPPSNLYEVMEATILYMYLEEIGVERARSTGRIDQLYYSYYKQDLESGRYTLDEIKEMLRYFYMRFQAAKRYADQPFTICGVDLEGNDATNELTWLLLDVYDGMNIHNPKIHVCCHEKMPKELLLKILDMIRRGTSSFCLISCEAVFKSYEKIGIPVEDARHFAIYGCYEPVLVGLEDPMIGSSWLNMGKAVEFAMNGGVDMMTGVTFGPKTPLDFDSYEDFYQAFLTQLKGLIDYAKENILEQDAFAMEINPSPVLSATFDSCMERGRDIYDGGLKYHNTSIKCFAIATAVDSLLMMKKFVFEEKTVSFGQMREILLRNWEGQELLRRKIRRDPTKFGNHIPEADRLAHDIYKFAASHIVNQPNRTGGVFRMGCDSITNCVFWGKGTGATPDGRMAGEACSKNFCASNGMDRKGVTALIQSVTALDATDFADAAVLDLVLHPSMVQGEAGLEAMYQMVRTYFDQGGFAIQGNVMDLETLLEAQREPEKYKHLQVRVCGWNEYFVEMKPDVQQQFILQLQEVV